MPLSQQEKTEQLNQKLWDQIARKNRQIVQQGLEIQRLHVQLRMVMGDAAAAMRRFTAATGGYVPADCRMRLKREGKAYPKSGCAVCKTGGLTGCPYERDQAAGDPPAPTGKPSWGDAPEWAKWLAQDGNGGWWWFDQKPVQGGYAFTSLGRHTLGNWGDMSINWRDTLEGRP